MFTLYQLGLIFNSELTPKKGSKIPFGIHTECKVTSIETEEGKFIDLNFEDSTGRYHNKRLWWPSGKLLNDIKNGDGTTRKETVAEAIAREERSTLAHIAKVVHIFAGKEALDNFPELDFNSTVKRALEIVQPLLASKQVNLKTIYDSEGVYSTFGNFPDYIEEYVPEQEPKLFYSKWEKENRSTYKGESQGNSVSNLNTSDIKSLFKKS